MPLLYEILKTKKTGIAPDLWTRLAAEKMAGDSEKVRELTGELPLTFRANGKPLIDYTIYGNMTQSKECGERTRNLFDKDNADIADLYPDAATREIKQSSNLSTWSIVLPVEPSTTYTFTMGEATTAIRRRVGMCSDYPTKGAYCTSVDNTAEYDHPNLGNIFTTDADTRYVLIMYVSGAGRDVAIERANRVQVVKGNTALPYEPYGYKIPISVNGQTNNIYIGSEPLRKAVDGSDAVDTLNYSTQQLIRRVDSSGNALAEPIAENAELPELPSNNGTTVIDAETALKPSKIYVKYKVK